MLPAAWLVRNLVRGLAALGLGARARTAADEQGSENGQASDPSAARTPILAWPGEELSRAVLSRDEALWEAEMAD